MFLRNKENQIVLTENLRLIANVHNKKITTEDIGWSSSNCIECYYLKPIPMTSIYDVKGYCITLKIKLIENPQHFSLHLTKKKKIVLTVKCNQDSLEKYFGIIRQVSDRIPVLSIKDLKEEINYIIEDNCWDLDNILLEHNADSTVFDCIFIL
ncbi:hypothetical protein QTP88_012809 [Uroleucon formosanum]